MIRRRHPEFTRGALRHCLRPGLSLLEVVVALAILLFSVVAIGQLISIGSDRAMDVQQQAHGSMLCQRKLAEVMVGAEPLMSSGYAPFPDSGLSDWQWKLDANQGAANGLWNVQVAVKFEGGDGRTIEVQMGQMILDPTIRGSSQDAPPMNTNTDSSSGTDPSASAATPSASSGASATPAKAASAAPAAAAPAPAKAAQPAGAAPATPPSRPAAGTPPAAPKTPPASGSKGGAKGS